MLYLTLTNSLGCLLRCERYETDSELKDLMLEILPYLETGDTINLTTDADAMVAFVANTSPGGI